MDYNSVHLMSDNQVFALPEAIEQLESRIDTPMPIGYKQYVTTLGLGVLNDTIRVYMPSRIEREYKEFQDRWRQFYFWEEGHGVLSKEKVFESIILADTGNGDEVIFHPSKVDKLYLLPRDSKEIFEVGSTLDEAIEWILNWDVLFEEEEKGFHNFRICG